MRIYNSRALPSYNLKAQSLAAFPFVPGAAYCKLVEKSAGSISVNAEGCVSG